MNDIAKKVLEKRYFLKNEQGECIEDFEGMCNRVVNHVAEWSPYHKLFKQMLMDLDFLPNSPTLMNAGKLDGQLFACFVLPVEDTMESIFETIKNAALIHKSGGKL